MQLHSKSYAVKPFAY